MMQVTYCTSQDCKNEAYNIIFVENRGYPVCSEHWAFAGKIHQLQVKWPKHRHKYIYACEMCGKAK